ncbi:hypothetical protein V8F33_010701 [Rhypophila sp. PSN 637]
MHLHRFIPSCAHSSLLTITYTMTMSELLPQHLGLLPYFLLFVHHQLPHLPSSSRPNNMYLTTTCRNSSLASIHSVVCYLAPAATALTQFQGPLAPPPHSLTARVYGVKNIYTALIRTYAAYHITNSQLYTLAMFTYLGALGLYATDVFYYKTTKVREATSTFVLTTSAIVWMVL